MVHLQVFLRTKWGERQCLTHNKHHIGILGICVRASMCLGGGGGGPSASIPENKMGVRAVSDTQHASHFSPVEHKANDVHVYCYGMENTKDTMNIKLKLFFFPKGGGGGDPCCSHKCHLFKVYATWAN